MDAHTSRTLTEALQRTFDMEPEDAREVADAVLSRFQDADEVDDESLDADLRSVFYTLEAKRMLSFRRVEYTREDGDRRRAFYWKLRLDALRAAEEDAAPAEVDVYASLPAHAWRHGVAAAL